LASSQIHRLKIQSTNHTGLTRTESSPEQRAYLQALDCESLIANTTLQPILKGDAILVVVTNSSLPIPETLAAQRMEKSGAKCGF